VVRRAAVLKARLNKVWNGKIEFINLHLPNPRKVPIGPNAVIVDDIGFTRRT
jgi:hypothetical protein